MIDNHMFQFVNLLTAVLAMNVIVTIIMVPNLLRHGATTKKWDWHSDSIKSNQTQARMGSAFTSDQILASRHILYDIFYMIYSMIEAGKAGLCLIYFTFSLSFPSLGISHFLCQPMVWSEMQCLYCLSVSNFSFFDNNCVLSVECCKRNF